MAIDLVTVFAGSTSYAVDHESNYAAIETAINDLQTGLDSSVSSGVPFGLMEIYDRRGIVGLASYKPVAATLGGPSYNVTIAAGAYWSGVELRRAPTSNGASLLAMSTGTLYVHVPTGGIPTVSDTPTADTVWQFAYNSGTHVVSTVALYSTCAVLFDGDDYDNSKDTFDQLSERLTAIEEGVRATVFALTYAATTSVDWSNGAYQRVTLTGNVTFAFSGAVNGQLCVLEIIQDATGSRIATWGAEVAFGTDITGAVLTTTVSKRDFVTFRYNSTSAKYYAVNVVKGY